METTRTVELLTTARWSCKGSIVKNQEGSLQVLPRKILQEICLKKPIRITNRHKDPQRFVSSWRLVPWEHTDFVETQRQLQLAT